MKLTEKIFKMSAVWPNQPIGLNGLETSIQQRIFFDSSNLVRCGFFEIFQSSMSESVRKLGPLNNLTGKSHIGSGQDWRIGIQYTGQ